MKVDVVMPKMGESVNEGTIIKWHKKEGDKVEKDEIIFEISTDKVDTEIPSPEDGVLSKIKAFEQETVEVDEVVAEIETDGEASSGKSAEDETEESKESTEEEEVSTEEPSTTQVGGELVDVTMPKMGESVMEGTIVKWHKQVGDEVKTDETIFEISTDKVDTEVPSPTDGTIAEIIQGENDTVEVGDVVARISTSGGVSKQKKAEAPKEEKKEQKVTEEPKEEKAPEPAAKKESTGVAAESKKSNRFYSPLVMNIAKQEGVSFDELESIEGSGIEGRVTKKDILAYVENKKQGKTSAAPKQEKPKVSKETSKAAETQPKTVESTENVEYVQMDNIRQRIMDHMVKSRDTSVHVTAVVEVDMTKIYNYIQNNKEKFLKQENVKLTYLPFISYATIKALKEHPLLNASIEEDKIAFKKYINLGVAVAMEPNGLIVPNIKKADEKSVVGLAKSIVELSEKARNKKLLPEDIMDGTFTITNYGIFGSLFGTPIINQPELGILGVGKVEKKPVVVTVDGTDTIAIKPMMYLSLSHDHRLVDGMLGGKFLNTIKNTLENFDKNLL